jgi:formamidopyrimidine-DNA glycosylase
MPELPEVETIRRDLDAKLRGARLRRVEVRLVKIVSPRGSAFARALHGAVIRNVRRRGKLLIFDMERRSSQRHLPRQSVHRFHKIKTVQFHRIGQLVMLIHLKMTGQLVLRHHKQITFGGHTIVGARELPNKYTHVIFYFTNGDELYFNDLRQFGYLKLVTSAEAQKILDEYGLEPLSRDFTLERFAEILRRRKNGKLKSVLMDQTLFAGVGNIYADESCFLARVRPGRRVSSLNGKELRALWLSVKKVLALSIKHRGTSFNTYVDSQGQTGNFVKYLKVYGRGGKPCKVCGTILKKTVLAGRGTVYCSHCQR